VCDPRELNLDGIFFRLRHFVHPIFLFCRFIWFLPPFYFLLALLVLACVNFKTIPPIFCALVWWLLHRNPGGILQWGSFQAVWPTLGSCIPRHTFRTRRPLPLFRPATPAWSPLRLGSRRFGSDSAHMCHSNQLCHVILCSASRLNAGKRS